jgi:acetolactate synthase small subunit
MYLFTILAEDRPGVLARITGILAARGENIARLTAAPHGNLSRISASVEMRAEAAEYARRKLLKLVQVVGVDVDAAAPETYVIAESLWPVTTLRKGTDVPAFRTDDAARC